MDLFVYGSLMVAQVMQAVSGHTGPASPAILHGYRRRRLIAEVYPAIVAWPGDRVEGYLYRTLEPAQFIALDRFEGDAYRRTQVRVWLDTVECDAQTYVLAPGLEHLLDDSDWSLEGFLVDGLRSFVADYPGFDAVGDGRGHGRD